MCSSASDRQRAGILGLLLGDALGVPFEFKPPAEIPPAVAIGFDLPPGYPRSHAQVPVGTWSDDGAQALCLLASLLEREALDLGDFGRRLRAWYDDGYLAVDGIVFDVGVTTAQAIRAMRAGVAADVAGDTDEHANGNGSLMRALPLALWHRGDDEALIDDSHRQSRVTHGHPRAEACCALYCLWARYVLRQDPAPWARAVASLREHYRRLPAHEAELEFHLRPDEPPAGKGSGYVVDSLRSARWATEQGDYAATVRAAIRLGHDTDTTACVAGGIAGLRDGLQGLPAPWLARLRGRELVDPLLDALVSR